MTIVATPAPASLERRAAAEAAAIAGPGPQFEAMLAGGPSAAPSAAEPLPIYSIPLEAISTDSAPLDKAEMHGWRVLTRVSSGHHLVDFAGREPGGRASAIRSPRAAELLVRAGTLAAARDRDDKTYEPRILEVSRLGFSALWLHCEDAPDLFYTLEEEPREQDAETLMAELAPRARRRLDSAAARRGSTGDEPNELGG
jgi:hypothetical protein